MGFLNKITQGLKKTRDGIANAINGVLDTFSPIDPELYDSLEEILIIADVGVSTAFKIKEMLKDRVRRSDIKDAGGVREALIEIVAELLTAEDAVQADAEPLSILVIGVNGVGKTTTIGKLASLYKSQGKKVILGAADTFRAAAIEQLEIWSKRADAELVKHSEGADPAAVVFDTISAGKARSSDVIICDTAGRLHNKKNLMDELAKIHRIIERELPESKKEVLLVLDATTGQNAVNQAREFKNVTNITGIVLTKLDGTAKGGVVLAIRDTLGIPVKFIGVGEQIDDLQAFEPEAFARALFDDKGAE